MSKQKDVLKFYAGAVTEEFVASLLEAEGVKPRAGIFKSVLVIWLMICQRLKGSQSLKQALDDLRLEESDELLGRGSGSIRVRTRRISTSTGGYAHARERTSVAVVKQVFLRLLAAMNADEAETSDETPDVYIIDGTTVQVSHSEKNLEYFAQYKNQHGKAHFPLVRVCVATNAVSGLSLCPAIGAYTGANGVGETTLAEELLTQLPKGAMVMGDRYYGTFRFAQAAIKNGVDVLCRIKEINSKRFIGTPLGTTGEKHVEWTPSPNEQKKYPELASAVVKGKFVWMPLARRGYRPKLFVLFTTSHLTPEKLFELYALRWNVETDLRDIKQTLDLQFISAKSPDMVRKEIILGVAAYNLIKHCVGIAAEAAKLPPRSLSFSMTLNRIRTLGYVMLSDNDERKQQRVLQRALTDLKALIIYRPNKKRPPEPRKIWSRGQRCYFSSNSSREFERSLLLQQSRLSRS